MTPPLSESVDDLAPSDLRRVVETPIVEVGRLQAWDGVKDALISQLQKRVSEQADEIARLKGLPPRPKFKGKPSGMEAATSKPLGGKKGRKAGRGVKRDRLAVTGEVKLKAQGVPPGSRFKGYEDITVQDLRISVAVTRYRRERWGRRRGLGSWRRCRRAWWEAWAAASPVYRRRPLPRPGDQRAADRTLERHGLGYLQAPGRALSEPGS
jgi:hypothetical protein